MSLEWRPPPADLEPYVSGFVERVDRKAVGPSVEFPLASPLLQIMLGSDYAFRNGDGLDVMPRMSLWGSATSARQTLPQGRLHAFAVILTFRGAALIAGDSPSRLADRRLDLSLLLEARWRSLGTRLREAEGLGARADIVCAWLRELASSRSQQPTQTLRIAQAIASHRLSAPVSHIAERCSASERTLVNRFRREVGWSPKRLLRVARLQRVVRACHPSPWGAAPGDDVRLEYFDEPHLRHDFRDLTGLSLADYVRGKRAVGDGLVHGFVARDALRI